MFYNIQNLTQNIITMFDGHAETILNFTFIPTEINFNALLLFLAGFLKGFHSDEKYQIFFFYLLSNFVLHIIQLGISNEKYQLAKFLETLTLKLVNYKEICTEFFANIFKNRFYIYLVANYSIIMTIKNFDYNKIFTLSFKGLHGKNYGVGLIINYILLRLEQYYTVKEVIFPIIRELAQQKDISGFKFVVAGRLDRTERATYMLKKAKSVPLATKAANIDYDDNCKILRYGMVGIKFWLNLLKFLPTHYKMKYMLALAFRKIKNTFLYN